MKFMNSNLSRMRKLRCRTPNMNPMHGATTSRKNQPISNNGQSVTCIFNRAHTNISRKKLRQHLRKCKERVKLIHSMLKPDDKRKVEGARGTTRVKGESYRQGEIYISSLHAELGQVEACYYDACHYITNSSTRYHCGDCCARISKERNTIDNNESGPITMAGLGNNPVFGPVFSSPAHGTPYLPMAHI